MRFPRPIGQLTEAEIMVIAGIPREEIRQEGEAAPSQASPPPRSGPYQWISWKPWPLAQPSPKE
jgi:hypothetical protein